MFFAAGMGKPMMGSRSDLTHSFVVGNVRFLRKAEVQGLQKRGAQHVRIKGQAVDLSPTDASASWER